MADVLVRQVIQSVEISKSNTDSKIVVRENVQAAKRKDQEHLCRPDADAFHLDESFDDFFVGKAAQSFELQGTAPHTIGEIEQVSGFLW